MDMSRTIVYWTTLVVLVLLAIMFVGRSSNTFVDTETIQAVFLSDGQVYFGELEGVNKEFLTLENVYYLEDSTESGLSDGEEGELTLIRLGSEVHEPQDSLHINKDRVLFIENLKEDSRIISVINQYSN